MYDVPVYNVWANCAGEICCFGAVKGDFDPVRAAAMCIFLSQCFRGEFKAARSRLAHGEGVGVAWVGWETVVIFEDDASACALVEFYRGVLEARREAVQYNFGRYASRHALDILCFNTC